MESEPIRGQDQICEVFFEMKYELTIDGRFPSYNEYTKIQRGNRYAGNRMKQEYQRTCAWQIRKKMRGVRIESPISVHVTCYEDKYNRDLDNVASFFFKVFLDALTECKVIQNDNMRHVTKLTAVSARDKRPRVEVVIEEDNNA